MLCCWKRAFCNSASVIKIVWNLCFFYNYLNFPFSLNCLSLKIDENFFSRAFVRHARRQKIMSKRTNGNDLEFHWSVWIVIIIARNIMEMSGNMNCFTKKVVKTRLSVAWALLLLASVEQQIIVCQMNFRKKFYARVHKLWRNISRRSMKLEISFWHFNLYVFCFEKLGNFLNSFLSTWGIFKYDVAFL